MTYKTFETGQVLTAADVQTIQDQSIIRVAGRAERDAIPASEGMRVYRLDTHHTDFHTGTRWIEGVPWTALELAQGITPLGSDSVPQFCVRDGSIRFRGACSGTITTNLKLALLPSGVWVGRYVRVVGATSDGLRRLNINQAGELLGNGSGTGNITWQSLDGIPPLDITDLD